MSAKAKREASASPSAKRMKLDGQPSGTGAHAPADGELDEDLHSRQLAVYGRESMRRMAAAEVLILGMKGLGVEVGEALRQPFLSHTRFSQQSLRHILGDVDTSVQSSLYPSVVGHSETPVLTVITRSIAAKNVILAGVKAVTLHDAEAVQLPDLGAQFYLAEGDVGSNRAQACQAKLQELNTAVAVSASSDELSEAFLSRYNVRALWSPFCVQSDALKYSCSMTSSIVMHSDMMFSEGRVRARRW